MFWRKPKPLPWYRKIWNSWYQMIVAVPTLFGVLTGAYAYVAVDTSQFIRTTEITLVTDGSRLYGEVDVKTEIGETTYVLLNVDGVLVETYVYPEGIPRGTLYIDEEIPFFAGEHFNTEIYIVINGLRTLFQPEYTAYDEDMTRGVSNENTGYTVSHAILRHLTGAS